MKRLLLLITASMLLLSGCVSTKTEMIFNGDKTIDVEVVYEIMKNDGATEEALKSIVDSAAEELDKNEIGHFVSEDTDAYRINIPLRFDNVSEMTSSTYFKPLRFVPQFTSTEESGKITVTITDEGDLTLSGTMSSVAMGIDSFFSQSGVDLSNITVSFGVTTPDGKSENWELTGSGEVNVEFFAKNIYSEGSGAEGSSVSMPLLAAIAGILILAVLLAVFIIVMKNLKKIKVEYAPEEDGKEEGDKE